MKSRILHLESITIDGFEKWKEESFSVYASCTTDNGIIQLGLDGNGKPCVYLNREKVFSFETTDKAIGKYQELLLES
jgi:hypothetical protein